MAVANQAPNAWKVLSVLFLANLFNFFDRAIPAVVAEPIRLEWGLSDTHIGIMATAFTVVYAIAGIPLGRMADTGSRKSIMGWGLVVWSLFTAAGAGAWSFVTFLLTRIGVGIGEASYAPAASSLIGDLFPADRRSRAVGIFMLGLPVGLVLAFFTVGAMVEAFGSWRAPFIIATIPGLMIAAMMFMIREPERGAAEIVRSEQAAVANPISKVLAIPTMRWVILAGIAANFASYATNAFMVPLIQRYFGLDIVGAAIGTGIIVGITGLIGLTLGGWLADRMHRRSERGRLMLGAIALALAAVFTWYALTFDDMSVTPFIGLFALGWLLQYFYYICVYPAIQDVVEPRLRATAMAVFFGALYLLGGAFGTIALGLYSDYRAGVARVAEGVAELSELHRGIGLHDAFIVVPIALALTAVAIFFAARTFPADARAMTDGMAKAAA